MEKQTVKICPKENLLNECKTDIQCPISNCNKVLFSSGCLKMHLVRSHGLAESDSDKALEKREKLITDVYKEYHCPVKQCIYNIDSERHFKNMAGLKQHFLKVHAEKKYKCSKCGHGFGMAKDMRRHESRCGIKYTCPTCQCVYLSHEALVLHCVRNRHPIPEEYAKKKKTDKKTTQQGNRKPDQEEVASNIRIPVILLPVTENSIKLIETKRNKIPIYPNQSTGNFINRAPVNHLMDHDYLPLSQSKEPIVNMAKTVVMQSSEIQTMISVPPQEKTKTIAQTQTGACILSQAMASADLPVEYTSTGTQVTPIDKGKRKIQMVRNDKESKNHKRKSKKKLYSSSDNGIRQEKNCSSEMRCEKISKSVIDTGTQFQTNSTSTQKNSFERNGKTSMSTSISITDFDFVQNVGVQTGEFQDYLLSQSDTNTSPYMETSSVGINTDYLLSQNNTNNSSYMETSSIGINTDKNQIHKCVGKDSFCCDSNVQTVDFDLLANSPEPQTEANDIYTQTVNFDFDSLESLVTHMETQTTRNINHGISLMNVETQTKQKSSTDTQTFSATAEVNQVLPLTNIETQTYDDYPEFIELFSSGTQTLDYQCMQDTQLSFNTMETQTGKDKNSTFNLGTQTSICEKQKKTSVTAACGSDSVDTIGNTSDDFQGEQMEFLVSEVLEMIPVGETPVRGNSHRKSAATSPNCGPYYHDSGSFNDNECQTCTNMSTETQTGQLTFNSDNQTQTVYNSDIQTQTLFNEQTQTNFSFNSDSQTQTGLLNFSDCNTQTWTNQNSIQTHDVETQMLINSETQTNYRQAQQEIDLTDSHTQTTWQELNLLLAELNR